MSPSALWGKKMGKTKWNWQDKGDEKGHCILTQLREHQALTKSQPPTCTSQECQGAWSFSDTCEIWPWKWFAELDSTARQKVKGAAPFLRLAALLLCSSILHIGRHAEGRFGWERRDSLLSMHLKTPNTVLNFKHHFLARLERHFWLSAFSPACSFLLRKMTNSSQRRGN